MHVVSRSEQRDRTRQRLAEVAAEVLVANGGTPPTTVAVQRAAGVSRGTLLHHFPTRAELLAAAVGTLKARHADAVRRALTDVEGVDQIERAVRALAASAMRPELSAELGLWAAARADDDLREALRGEERAARDALHAVVGAAFGPDVASMPAFPRVAALTVQFMRGLTVTHALRDTGARTDALVRDWAATVRLLLAEPRVLSAPPADGRRRNPRSLRG